MADETEARGAAADTSRAGASEADASGSGAGAAGAGGAGALEAGTYEILRGRLETQARALRERAEALNALRIERFGGTELEVLGTERIRTENNCVPRDIVRVGRHLLFGYNVFVGLRTETRVDDVFSLQRFRSGEDDSGEGGFAFEPVAPDAPENFLADPKFVADFQELYRYYKDTSLRQLRVVGELLLAVFQTGAGEDDVKVLRFALENGTARYVDNRGERDHVFPPSHDFEWIETTRDDHVLGRHPHVSIQDELFVETVGGDLTVKLEDNTEDGLGIYREDVDEPHQSLGDARILYARVGPLILLRILPYNETAWRHFVYSQRTREVQRVDAIGRACRLLPEDHGIIFPGGYALADGRVRTFDADVGEMIFKKAIRSPNGEDVLYLFYDRIEGRGILLVYNLIRKQVQPPIATHGMALDDDGTMIVFRARSEEPTRIHPMQIWSTPFVSDLHAATTTAGGETELDKVGNADLVRGISDALAIARDALDAEPSALVYEELAAATVRMGDAYFWLGTEFSGGSEDESGPGPLGEPLATLRGTAETILDEYAKVEMLRAEARGAQDTATEEVESLLRRLRGASRDSLETFVEGLGDLRRARGRLIPLGERRYVDAEALAGLDERLREATASLEQETVEFLLAGEALAPYRTIVDEQVAAIDEAETAIELVPLGERLDGVGDGLELLTEVVGGLDIEDPTERTRILETISEVLATLNRARALVAARRKELARGEGAAEFGAEFQLFAQSVSGALAMASTPEACDEQLARLLLRLEELEARFAELDDEFLDQLATQRDEVYDAFESKKQMLLDDRQRRVDRLVQAAERILDGVRRRATAQPDAEALGAYFVGDAMVAKLRAIADDLRELGDAVRADELLSRLASTREEAGRALRDRRDLYEDGAEVIRLGKHRFSVNTRPIDLALVPRESAVGELELTLHMTGTDFYEPLEDPDLEATRAVWDQRLISETLPSDLGSGSGESASGETASGPKDSVYRAEYLAASILWKAEAGEIDSAALHEAAASEPAAARVDGTNGTDADDSQAPPPALLALVRAEASARYDEGYERGIHDFDAAKILAALLQLRADAGLLRYAPRPRAHAGLFWAFGAAPADQVTWRRRARSLGRLRRTYDSTPEIESFTAELETALASFLGPLLAPHSAGVLDAARRAADYLFEELAEDDERFAVAEEAVDLVDALFARLAEDHEQDVFAQDLASLGDDLRARWRLARAWLDAVASTRETPPGTVDEAAALLLIEGAERDLPSSQGEVRVEGLLGQHPRIQDRALRVRLDEFEPRLERFERERVPLVRRFQAVRHRVLAEARQRLRIDEYRPKVMSAFVRNQLIDQVYLPLVGDNFAKQMGALGDAKRTDQMGLLLLVSPPGYGKTTLMEYVANRLGLIFVKVNGPALGHGVRSLDPAEAPNATARQEVEKIDFALEMGNNVLLYLDDIQHTHPELLQKFISLCDAQRRMEGVWRGETRTYDLKGKRFAVVMAGNPYTESGERFQVPDMLANRADTYNLGDVLSGREAAFEMSFLENALTSNPVLAPLAGRDPADVRLLARRAAGDETATSPKHPYGQVELEQILSVLSKVQRVRETVLRVNAEYIASAAMDDTYRTEPRFRLQGSYRDMNKMVEKISPVMDDAELEALVRDHYRGEAQTLTSDAESNLLKLGELRGTLDAEQAERWESIRRDFSRRQSLGGAEDDPAVRMIAQLGDVAETMAGIREVLASSSAAWIEQGQDDTATRAAAHTAKAQAAAIQRLDHLASAVRDGLEALARTAEAANQSALEAASKHATSGPSEAPLASTPPRPAVDPDLGAELTASILERLDVFLERLSAVVGGVQAVKRSAAKSKN